MTMSQAEHGQFSVRYSVPRWNASWAVPEIPVPESDTHDLSIEYLRGVLLAWARRTARHVKLARNLGIRWVEQEPRAGFDPDLCLIEPPPPDRGTLRSLCLWRPGHVAPRLAVEVVSSHPYKDYIDTPERCAACGVAELWIYDPMMLGPKAHGGPYLIQVWCRDDSGNMHRIHAGSGPVYSPALGAWLHPVESDEPQEAQLRLADDATGRSFWPTLDEAAQQHVHAEKRRADAAEAELARLRAQLERK